MPEQTITLTPAEQRAKDYIGIFYAAGEKWADCVPIATRFVGDSVFIDDVELRRNSIGRWGLKTADGWVWFQVAKAEK